jgi:gas vesicle protein
LNKSGANMSKHRKRKSRLGSYLKGVFYGSLVGAGLAIVYTPRKGEQSLELLKETAEETSQRIEEFARISTQRVNELTTLGADLYSEGKGLIESTIEGIKEGARNFNQDRS